MLAVVTTLLAGFTYNLLVVTRSGLIEDQRPWLAIKANIVGPLKGGENISVQVVADVSNVGKSTARNVYVHVEMFGGIFLRSKSGFSNLSEELWSWKKPENVGSFLAPTEREQLGTIASLPLERFIVMDAVDGLRFIGPYIAVILTYRGMDSEKRIRYTARNFAVVEARAGHDFPSIIDLDRLPMANAFLSSYPKHARAT